MICRNKMFSDVELLVNEFVSLAYLFTMALDILRPQKEV